MLGLNLTRVSKGVRDDWYAVLFKRVQIDIFVADIGLYLSCLFTEIKSAHTL